MKRNQHEGESLLVIASGPSLNDFNVNDLQKYRTIGMNQTSRRFDPDYVCLLDSPRHFGEGMPYAMRSLLRAQCLFHSNNVADWLMHAQGRAVDHEVIDWAPGHSWREWKVDEYQEAIDAWGDELTTLPHGPTSAGVAVWLAAWLGASKVGVIGVDMGDDYFHESQKPFAVPEGEDIIDTSNRHWGSLSETLHQVCGVEMFNLSQRSKITSFPTARLHEL